MSVELIETRRLLAADRGIGHQVVGLAAVAILCGWCAWAALVEVPLTLSADEAHLVAATDGVSAIGAQGDRTLSAHFTAPDALLRLHSGQKSSFLPAGSRAGRPLAGTVLSVMGQPDGTMSVIIRVTGAEALPSGLGGDLSIETGRRTPLALLAELLGIAGEPTP